MQFTNGKYFKIIDKKNFQNNINLTLNEKKVSDNNNFNVKNKELEKLF